MCIVWSGDADAALYASMVLPSPSSNDDGNTLFVYSRDFFSPKIRIAIILCGLLVASSGKSVGNAPSYCVSMTAWLYVALLLLSVIAS